MGARHAAALLTLGASFALCLASAVRAEIIGTVLVEGSGVPGQPIEGAEVRVQADLASPVAITDVNGDFTLAVNPAGSVKVVAAVPYDPSAVTTFTSAGATASNGADVTIRLAEIPTVENTTYVPIRAATPGGCGDCHGEQLAQWTGSAHAGAAVDTWVRDLYSGDGTAGGAAGYVYRDLHPGETGFCATCHAPVAEAHAPGTAFLDEVVGDAALEGVTCSACHQLDRFTDNLAALHLVGDPEPGAAFRLPLAGVGGSATHEYVWGPLGDVDYPFMRAAYAPVFATSRACASCHEYENPTTGTPGQTTYSEWASSPYAVPGTGFRSCQDCHMPEATEAGPIADPVLGSAPVRPAAQRHEHSFIGATPSSLAASVDLQTTAAMVDGRLVVEASVANLGAGHAFPTGISLRNAILLVSAKRSGVPLAQLGGPQVPWWADDTEPGQQAGDLAGQPGRGFAKVLEGEIGGERVKPVLFIEADTVAENTTLPAGATAMETFTFSRPADAQPGDVLEVEVELLYRRAWRALAVTKGWTETPAGGPIEIEVAAVSQTVPLTSADFEIFADGFESGDALQWSAVVP